MFIKPAGLDLYPIPRKQYDMAGWYGGDLVRSTSYAISGHYM